MSEPSDDANRWTWVNPDGKTVMGAKGELMLALRGGRLPPTTLVWRAGWAEWLPATRVTELKSVLPPGAAEPAQAPKLGSMPPPAPVRGTLATSRPPPAPIRNKPATSHPPPAPVRTKPEPRKLLEIPSPRVPTSGATTAVPGAAVRPRGVSILGPPREQMTNSADSRAPLPTLTGDDLVDPRMNTLRPPGAVPPPPRVLGPVLGSSPKPEDELPTQRKVPSIHGTPTPAVAVLATRTRASANVSELAAKAVGGARAVVEPPAARRETNAARVPDAPRGSTTNDAVTPVVEPAAPSTESTTTATSGDATHHVGTNGAGSLAGFEGTRATTMREQTAPIDVASAVTHDASRETIALGNATAPVDAAASPAQPAASPTQKDELVDALPGDRPVTLPIPRSVALALALAVAGLLVLVTGGVVFSTQKHAAARSAPEATAPASAKASDAAPGCRLLAPAARLAITAERSVQPVLAELVQGERVEVGFAPSPKVGSAAAVRLDTLDTERSPDQTGDALVRSSVPLVKSGHTELVVDRAMSALSDSRTLPDGATLGFAGADLVRQSGGKSSVLAAGAASEKTTEPRIGTSSAGTLITFRRGGLAGEVLYTWLAADGTTSGSMTPVNTPDVKSTGTPDAAVNAKAGLLAFAARASDTAEWRVHLVSVPRHGRASVKQFATPAGGAGGGNIAPAVAAFGDDGWLLQWTEGATGAYEVRLQRLNAELEPVGDARLVSPKGANAGQGTVFATGTRALSVFIQTTAGHDELWGASFACH